MDARFETDSSSIFYFTSLLADVARLPRNFIFSMRAHDLSLLLLRVSQIFRLLVINIIIIVIPRPLVVVSSIFFNNQVFGLHLVGGPSAGLADGGPLKVPREEHVPDEGLDRRLAHEAHEEQLLYDGGRHRPEGGQSQQQLSKPRGLVGVVVPAVLLKGTL